ncbi:MAG: alpha/beta hydrolase [Chromatiales bacterium]|nr:alpha/beta hydrolase [Chromatiales bacterium]
MRLLAIIEAYAMGDQSMHDHCLTRVILSYPVGGLLALMIATTSYGETLTDEEDFWEEPQVEVNEGVLEFLSQPPEKPVHHHQNLIMITLSSLQNGWVELSQCHHHLDPVPRLEIVYNPQRIRDIRIVSSRNIGSAEVVGHKLDLSDVGRAAEICLIAQSRALHNLGGGVYQLRNGPYMRRFLDGYYPMQLSLEVRYPAASLQLNGQRPLPEEGVDQQSTEGRFKWGGWFTGKLSTQLDFINPASK